MKQRRDAYTDDTLMPWGPHKGTRLADVPPEHLDYLLKQTWLKEYVYMYDYLSSRRDDISKRLAALRLNRGDDEIVEQTSSFEDYMKDYRGF